MGGRRVPAPHIKTVNTPPLALIESFIYIMWQLVVRHCFICPQFWTDANSPSSRRHENKIWPWDVLERLMRRRQASALCPGKGQPNPRIVNSGLRCGSSLDTIEWIAINWRDGIK